MRHPDDAAIGGYFALEEASSGTALPVGERFLGYQSARCAMAAALQSADCERVWVPHYICGAVLSAIEWTGIELRRYCLAEDRGVPRDLDIGDRDIVVCVDYFGLTAASCAEAQQRLGADRVLFDCAQALFHPPSPGASTVYSPRKFAGLPDGGLLVTPNLPPPPLPADQAGTTTRGQALRARAEGRVAEGYRLFQAAEASLADCTPRAISEATATALASVDWKTAGQRRVENYQALATLLGESGMRVLPLPPDAVPLCCPVAWPQAAAARKWLANEGIFTPHYWPDSELPPGDGVALVLRDHTLYLPCDQRYHRSDMLRVAQTLAKLRGER